MNPEQFQRASTIFLAARILEPEKREAFVQSECSGDERLAAEVLRLLHAEQSESGALHTRAMSSVIRDAANEALVEFAVAGTDAEDDNPRPPDRIGPYRVIRLIGRGGMGSVYEADQDVPRRRVAIKMIRSGVVSPDVLRRFRHEIEVLGRLHHPGIAQVFDAGTFDHGDGAQPYFAMEFIDGLPLVDHASRQGLSIRDRLALVATVADAVEHAHRAGVIHRDLKPGNILVDESGDQALPKILDFGVARAIDPDVRLTTIQTNVGQLIGTLAYMSPEQARGDPVAMDARTDVYALGVIAYELLAVRIPLDVYGRGIQEAMRIVNEVEPASLSTVDRSLRGDVETIIATALAKEPERRYQSAAAFAADIRRYLRDEPIVARPASTLYQLRKFARRNRGLVTGVALAFALLIVAVIGTSVGLVRAREETRRAQRMNEFLSGMIAWFEPAESPGGFVTLRQVLQEAERRADSDLRDDPAVASGVQAVIGQGFTTLAMYEEAEAILLTALETSRREFGARSVESAQCLDFLGVLARRSGRPAVAETRLREALAIRIDRLGRMHDNVAESMNNLAAALLTLGRMGEAEELMKESLEIHERVTEGEDEALGVGLSNLAAVLIATGRHDEAEPYLRRSIDIRRRLGGRALAQLPQALGQLASIASHGRNASDEAIALLTESLDIYREYFGIDHPNTCRATTNLAYAYYRRAEFERSVELYASWAEYCVPNAEKVDDLKHIRVSYGHALLEVNRPELAEPLLRAAVDMPPGGFQDVANGLMGACLVQLGRADEAREFFDRFPIEQFSRGFVGESAVVPAAMAAYEHDEPDERFEHWRAALDRINAAKAPD